MESVITNIEYDTLLLIDGLNSNTSFIYYVGKRGIRNPEKVETMILYSEYNWEKTFKFSSCNECVNCYLLIILRICYVRVIDCP